MKQQPRNRKRRGKSVYNYVSALKIVGNKRTCDAIVDHAAPAIP